MVVGKLMVANEVWCVQLIRSWSPSRTASGSADEEDTKINHRCSPVHVVVCLTMRLRKNSPTSHIRRLGEHYQLTQGRTQHIRDVWLHAYGLEELSSWLARIVHGSKALSRHSVTINMFFLACFMRVRMREHRITRRFLICHLFWITWFMGRASN